MGNTTMPSPWEMTPQEKWAENFRENVNLVTSRIQENGVERYQNGVREAFERAGVDVDVAETSKAVNAFSNSVDKFSDEAMRRTTALAAANYYNQVGDVDVDGAEQFLGDVGDYDDTDGSEEEFMVATEVLGTKFINNWGQSYEGETGDGSEVEGDIL